MSFAREHFWSDLPHELDVLIHRFEAIMFGHRRWVVGTFVVLTVFMAYAATQLRVDAGFTKLLPLEHEYMQTFVEHREAFGGANRVLIALVARDGDIFSPRYFEALKALTDDVFFIPGVDRTQVRSLFTPNVRFTEVVADGIAGGNVIPADFRPTPDGLARVRENILKAGIVGRLVASDFSGAMVSAEFLEFNPNTGEKLDYITVAGQLEALREKYEGEGFDVHIIGFAKVIGDIAEGAGRVVAFFGVAFGIIAVLVYVYAQSFRLSLIPLVCPLMAVIWQLGFLSLLGYGLDPLSILVPFLIFAIGVSHAVQMLSAYRAEVFGGASTVDAARAAFWRLLTPGIIALVSDAIGFITILLIDVRIIQEMAITASLGVSAIILMNFVLLPVLISCFEIDQAYRDRLALRARHLDPLWRWLGRITHARPAAVIIAISALLLGLGAWKATQVQIGDLHRGVPELRADSRYNLDSELIASRFSIGVDVLSVIVETVPEACVDYDIMSLIDRFAWQMRNVPGVHSAVSLPQVAKIINAGWNEGSLEWRVLPRDPRVMAQAVTPVDTDTGLLNADCSVMPVILFTADHRADTIERIVREVKAFREAHGTDAVRFRLASGNVGIMAATNEEVAAAQFPILLYVFAAVIGLCLLTFRSVAATACIVLPLGLVSLLAYALMALLEIGLKVNTLPVVALGVGVGVDYGIYIYSRLSSLLAEGRPLELAYDETMAITGSGVIFTGLTMAVGVVTWIFSPLKFQADMGILLTFMFVVNMLGAIILLPALARWLLGRDRARGRGPDPS